MVYCELHAHQGDLARVTMYENDLCQVAFGGVEYIVLIPIITDNSVCFNVVALFISLCD